MRHFSTVELNYSTLPNPIISLERSSILASICATRMQAHSANYSAPGSPTQKENSAAVASFHALNIAGLARSDRMNRVG